MAKFLIDECLTPDLVEVAVRRGHPESRHVVWIGKAGWKDWQLKAFILEDDWTFVTRNSIDFRGNPRDLGATGQYSDVALHAGLICINGPQEMTAGDQCELFEAVLEELGNDQLVNEVIEVTLASLTGEYSVERYALPA